MKKFILFVSVILMASQSLLSQWVWQNPLPHGNSYNNIKFINSNTGFVVGDFGKMYKTTNQGTNWNRIDLPTFSNINTVYFRNSNTGWVCADSALLFKTTNGGLNWIRKTTEFYGSYKDIYFLNDSTGILSIGGYPDYSLGDTSYVLRTTNYGDTWDSVHTLVFNRVLNRISFINENTGWILYTRFWMLMPPTQLTDIKYIATTNGGFNWTEYNVKTYQGSYIPGNSIMFNNANTGFITGEFSEVIRTSNAGINWSSQPLNIYSLNFVNQNLGYATGNKIFRTTNAGNNWAILDSNLPVYSRTSFFIDSTKGWIAGTGGSIYKTTNGGSSNQDQTFGTKQSINGISFSGESTGYSCGNKGVFMKTTNSGNNWVTININTFTSKNLTCINFLNNNTGWIGCDSAIFKTIDGGLTWSRKNIPVSNINDRINKIVFTNPGIGFASVNNSGKLYKSTDFGESWTLNYSLTNKCINIMFLKPDIWFAISQTKFLKSTNNGINWINSYASEYELYDGYFLNENTGWVNRLVIIYPAYVAFNISRTTNGGINWTNQGSIDAKNLYFHNANEGVFTNGSSLFKTTNGGSAWIKENYGGNKILNSIGNGMDLYVTGEYGMIMRKVNSFSTSAKEISNQIPERYSLSQNFPNPFNPTTRIKFDVVKSGDVKIVVYDVTGREVQTLVNERLPSGTYETTFDGSGLTSGVYFYRLTASDNSSGVTFTETKRLIYLK